jgi:hypothetical protein
VFLRVNPFQLHIWGDFVSVEHCKTKIRAHLYKHLFKRVVVGSEVSEVPVPHSSAETEQSFQDLEQLFFLKITI